MTNNSTIKPDTVGALASGLCILHCIGTPLLFLVHQANVDSCSMVGPRWWSNLDILFILISLLAIYGSSKETPLRWMKSVMLTVWLLLSLFLVNERLHLIHFSEIGKHVAASVLIMLHLYNHRISKCIDETCPL